MRTPIEQESHEPLQVSTAKRPARSHRKLLVHGLAALALIAGLIHLALPSRIVWTGREPNLAVTRAEAINMATAAFIQARGRENAEREWSATEMDQQRYELLTPYLAFAPKGFEDYLPKEYALELPEGLKKLSKVTLVHVQRTPIGY